MGNGSTVYINFFGEIDPKRANDLMSVCTDILGKHLPDAFYFLFASTGGNVNAGVVLYNFLRSLPVKVTMHNMGVIDSIANIIFAAGAVRFAAPHSRFLFHGVVMNVSQAVEVSYDKLVELKSTLESDQAKMVDILCERTNLTEREIKHYFSQGTARDAEFAKLKGIVHEVRLPEIPAGAPLFTINGQ